jgi:hypothetical protein
MDPLSLATAAVSLIVPVLGRAAGHIANRVGDDLGEAVTARLERLYEAIKARLAPGSYADGALQRLEEQPDNERRKAALQDGLTELIEADPAFGKELLELIRAAEAAGGREVVQIMDAGAISIGGDVKMRGTNVAGRDMTVQGAPRPGDEQHPPPADRETTP